MFFVCFAKTRSDLFRTVFNLFTYVSAAWRYVTILALAWFRVIGIHYYYYQHSFLSLAYILIIGIHLRHLHTLLPTTHFLLIGINLQHLHTFISSACSPVICMHSCYKHTFISSAHSYHQRAFILQAQNLLPTYIHIITVQSHYLHTFIQSAYIRIIRKYSRNRHTFLLPASILIICIHSYGKYNLKRQLACHCVQHVGRP